MRLLIIVALLLIGDLSSSETLENFYKRRSRPSIFEISQIENIDQIAAPKNEIEPTIWLYRDAVPILLELAADRDLFLLSRDLDELYDFVTYFLSKSKRFKKYSRRFHRLAISREVARSASLNQMTEWLRIHGIDLDKLRSGDEKVSFVDIGWVGQIYKNILAKLIADPYAKRIELRNLLNGMDFYLMASHNSSSYIKTKRYFESDTVRVNPANIIGEMRESGFTFTNLFRRPGKSIAPMFRAYDYSYQLNFVWKSVKDHFRHWNPRGTKLSERGDRLVSWDPMSSVDAVVDRQEFLARLNALRIYLDDDQHVASLEKAVAESCAFLLEKEMEQAPL